MAQIVEVKTHDEFETQVIEEMDERVLAYFWSPTCPHCARMTPNLEAADQTDDARFVKVSFEDLKDLFSEYTIRRTPTVIVFGDGQEIDRHVGAMDTEEIIDWLDR